MTSYEEALRIVLETVSVLPGEEQPLADCLGQVAARDVRSSLSLPQRATCGPDGYAVRAADVANATRENPAVLHIGETVRAGAPPKHKVVAGTAARVMTGSMFPTGADCVIRFEDTDEPGNKCGPNLKQPTEVRIFTSAQPGTGVTPAGTLVKRGDLVMPAGTVIGPTQISALNAIGLTKLKVHRRPKVAIIATGDELMAAGKPLRPAKNYNANAPALLASVRHHGGVPRLLGIARDNQASLEKKFAEAAKYDVILTSGGVSKGDFDLIRVILGKQGKVVFNRIGLGPGVAFTFGLIARGAGKKRQMVPVFALSGPPVGCLLNFETLVRPALRKMMGFTELRHRTVEAHAQEPIENHAPFKLGRWSELRRNGNGYEVDFHNAKGGMGAGMISQLAHSNALTVLPQGAKYAPGDNFEVLPLDWLD